jgi:hypothetical protein
MIRGFHSRRLVAIPGHETFENLAFVVDHIMGWTAPLLRGGDSAGVVTATRFAAADIGMTKEDHNNSVAGG